MDSVQSPQDFVGEVWGTHGKTMGKPREIEWFMLVYHSLSSRFITVYHALSLS